MTVFKLKLEMGSTGARDADDIARLLMEAVPRVAAKVGEDGDFGLIRDEDGKRIGRWDFSDNDPGEFVVGEEDTTDQEYSCGWDGRRYYDSDGDEMYECTRKGRHTGVHAAGNGDVIVATWKSNNE